MKNDLKISTLSVACVLCTAFVSPAFSAAPVRALGGVGTYSSASNAASAKVSGAKGSNAISAVRGGSMRVNSSASGKTTGSASGVTSTRVATTPRLSIGKYLSGSATLGSATVGGSGNVDSAGNGNSGLPDRVEELEGLMAYVGYSHGVSGNDKVNISVDIETLREDLKVVTDGYLTGADFEDGVLKIYANDRDKDIEIDFNNYVTLDALDAAVNVAIAENLADYALQVDLEDLEGRIAALELDGGATEELADIRAAIESLQGAVDINDKEVADLAGKVIELQNNYASKVDLQGVIDSLQNYYTKSDVYTKAEVDAKVASAGNFDATQYYNKTDADAKFATNVDLNVAKAGLVAAQTEITSLQDTLKEMGDVAGAEELNKLAARVGTLENSDVQNNEDIVTLQADVKALQDATQNYATKVALQNLQNSLSSYVTAQSLNTALEAKANIADVYTKSEVDAKVASAGNFDASQYYDKTYINANLATKAEIPVVPVNVSAFNNDAGYVTGDALTAIKTTADSAKSLADSNAETLLKLNEEYATDSELADVKKELSDEISAMTGGQNLGALAYKDTVSTTEIENNSVTMDKINTTALNGGMAIVQNTADGTQLVPVVIVDKDGNPVL
ncbi:MAG: hypothetical protein IKB10_01535 [Alphaproteobacteria bacterium]|nr:hypothetical protein [Alphaproteobacteria bacterium]